MRVYILQSLTLYSKLAAVINKSLSPEPGEGEERMDYRSACRKKIIVHNLHHLLICTVT